MAARPAAAAPRIWTGAGANNLWTTPQNWQGNVAPAAGDGLGFPAGAQQTTNVNNYPNGTLFVAIFFTGTYIVSGNRVTIERHIDIQQTPGTIVLFQCDVVTGGNGAPVLTLGAISSASLVMTGAISGPRPFVKAGLGTVNLGGTVANSFEGMASLEAGLLVLNKTIGVTAIPNGINVGMNAGGPQDDILRLGTSHQIRGHIRVFATGRFEVNGHTENADLLTLLGGRITTGAGVLGLITDVNIAGSGAVIEGNLSLLGATRAFNTLALSTGSPSLAITAIIANGGIDAGIVKRGPGILALDAANTYSGVTRVDEGTLWVLDDHALGAAAADAGTGVLGAGRLALGANVVNEPLLLQKDNLREHAVECTGNFPREWRGPIHLTGSNGFFAQGACSLRLGPVIGTGEFWTSGSVIEMAEPGSTFVGDTRIQSGTLRINGANRLPDTTIVKLPTTGTFSLNGFDETVASIAGAAGSQVQLGGGTLVVASPPNTQETFAGVISGTGDVVHGGRGQWTLTGANAYLGTTAVTRGTLRVDGSLAAASNVVISGIDNLLTGTGRTGLVAGVVGRFEPGTNGTGTFTANDIVLNAQHTTSFGLGAGPPSRVSANGSVNLGGALDLRKVGTSQIDTPLVLIDNDGSDAIVGTFAGLAEGATVDLGGQTFRVSYVGGTGNDFTIAPTELTYFLAEGSTGSFFDTDIAIANPHAASVPVTVEFLVEGGGQVITQAYDLPPMSRTSIAVDAIPGLASAAVSTKVRSTAAQPIVVERTMWWGSTRYGAHTEKASGGAAPVWYFAEGSQGFFDTFLLLANPIALDNVATVRFLLEGGGNVSRTYTLSPLSRYTVYAGEVPELVNQSFGIEVTFSQGGVAERAMYFGDEPLWNAGHESAGVTAPSTTWFLAEGATGPFFETFILLANPNAAAADATVRFLPASGVPVVKQFTVPANGRSTINIEGEDASLANVPVATDVSSSLPIVVERAQYWPDPFDRWYEAHNSFGMTETATKWGLAEGRVGTASEYQTYVLLANPGAAAANVTITFLRQDGAPVVVKQFTVNPTSRLNVAVGAGTDVPELANELFGALIESSAPIVVERAMYANAGGQVWGAGTNATATKLP